MAEVFTDSLSKIIKSANQNITLSKGLHEVTKALESEKKPLFVVLAEDCNEARYKQLVEALCK
jgi:ribosomal protein L7Ae-like RNA K-turn-binding protein